MLAVDPLIGVPEVRLRLGQQFALAGSRRYRSEHTDGSCRPGTSIYSECYLPRSLKYFPKILFKGWKAVYKRENTTRALGHMCHTHTAYEIWGLSPPLNSHVKVFCTIVCI